jgi:protein tyrosine phosphatase (PTP) superfamily phosphohydrolase (DUF442 family)
MADPDSIYHWHRLDAAITTSGQPTEAELVALRDLGVRQIINLAPHSHAKALPDEQTSVERLGMAYVNIPVDFQNPTEADFALFCHVMEQARGTAVHVHCAANYRVSAFFYRYRRDVLGLNPAAIRPDLDSVWQPDAVWSRFIGL